MEKLYGKSWKLCCRSNRGIIISYEEVFVEFEPKSNKFLRNILFSKWRCELEKKISKFDPYVTEKMKDILNIQNFALLILSCPSCAWVFLFGLPTGLFSCAKDRMGEKTRERRTKNKISRKSIFKRSNCHSIKMN